MRHNILYDGYIYEYNEINLHHLFSQSIQMENVMNCINNNHTFARFEVIKHRPCRLLSPGM